MVKKGLNLNLTELDDLSKFSSDEQITELAIDEIEEDANQPRKSFNKEKLKELSESIKQYGVMQPIVVNPKNANGKYVIVFGARRYKASLLAGKTTIPVKINTLNDSETLYAQVVENVQREDLSPYDIALSIKVLVDAGIKKIDIATKFGKGKSYVTEHLSLLSGSQVIQDIAKSKEIGIRTLYNLTKAHEEFPEQVEEYISATEDITASGIKNLITTIKSGAAETIHEIASQEPEAIEEKEPNQIVHEKKNTKNNPSFSVPEKSHKSRTAIIINHSGRLGVIDDSAIVRIIYSDTQETKEVRLSDIEIIKAEKVYDNTGN